MSIVGIIGFMFFYLAIALIFYSLCGMIRLAYFNTLDICKKADKKLDC